MNRLTAPERLALILLLALVAGISAARWWRTHRAGMENRDSLPPQPVLREATEERR